MSYSFDAAWRCIRVLPTAIQSMHEYFKKNGLIKHTSLFTVTALLLCINAPKLATADSLAQPGQRATLTVSLSVEGIVEQKKGYRDEVVRWSTKRSLEAKVEMIAGKAEKMPSLEGLSDPGGTTKTMLDDIQKQAAACGDNQLCQMRVAMQMMNSPAIQGMADSPLRYQAWRPAGKDAPIEVSGSHTETLHTVFYTAARETTDCTMTAPKVSSELTTMEPGSGEKWAAANKETLENSARSFTVEVDGVDKVGALFFLSPLSVGSGEIECVQNIGSGPEKSHHSKSEALLPTDEIKLPLKVVGAVTGGNVIASGSTSFKSNQKLNNLGVGFAVDVTAPLDITVRWELRANL